MNAPLPVSGRLGDTDAALARWRSLLGDAQVLGPDDAHAAYGADASGYERRFAAALRVQDAAQVPEVVRIAAAHRVPLHPISTGHNWGYGTALPVRSGCVLVDLSALRGIVHFDPELGTVTLEPGVTQGQLADFLAQGDHAFLVPVTGAGPSCSLLANALERGYGVTPYTDHFGAVTDLEAVLADGSLYRTALREAGGESVARLFKWGIGPYSAGLFTQSGFGIVTRMTIKLARRPEGVKVCLFSLADDALLEPAVERIRDVLSKLRGTVGAINLMNRHRVLAMSAPFPRDALGADGLIPPAHVEAMGRQYQILPWTGFVTLYGTRRIVAAAQQEIKAALAGVASRRLFLTPERARQLSDVAGRLPGPAGRRLRRTAGTLASSLELVAGRPNETALPLAYWRHPNPPTDGRPRDPARDGCGLTWYAPLVPMRPAGVRAYVEMVRRVTREHAFEPLITLTSIDDTLFDSTVPLLFDRSAPGGPQAASGCYRALLHAGREIGCFPYRVGIDTMGELASLQTHATALHARLKQALDPDDLLAPGRYA